VVYFIKMQKDRRGTRRRERERDKVCCFTLEYTAAEGTGTCPTFGLQGLQVLGLQVLGTQVAFSGIDRVVQVSEVEVS
jgi:hypothetical protein